MKAENGRGGRGHGEKNPYRNKTEIMENKITIKKHTQKKKTSNNFQYYHYIQI